MINALLATLQKKYVPHPPVDLPELLTRLALLDEDRRIDAFLNDGCIELCLFRSMHGVNRALQKFMQELYADLTNYLLNDDDSLHTEHASALTKAGYVVSDIVLHEDPDQVCVVQTQRGKLIVG